MTKERKQEIFAPMLKYFETELFKDYFMDMVATIPDYIFDMPASTTGKYHNKTQVLKHGQIYHEYMFASILNHRLDLKWNKERCSIPEIRDAMRCVPVFHDAFKCGTDEEYSESPYTRADHPILASMWVINTKVEHDIPSVYKLIIANMCETHSGEWNKNRNGHVIMQEPRNEREFFIHECDYLASRMDLDWIITDELREILGD